MKQDFIEITGMTCINCQNRIQAGIAALDGVRRVSVDYKTGQADVEYDENVCRIDQIRDLRDFTWISGSDTGKQRRKSWRGRPQLFFLSRLFYMCCWSDSEY